MTLLTGTVTQFSPHLLLDKASSSCLNVESRVLCVFFPEISHFLSNMKKYCFLLIRCYTFKLMNKPANFFTYRP